MRLICTNVCSRLATEHGSIGAVVGSSLDWRAAAGGGVLALDYMPAVRAVCRSEGIRKAGNTRRRYAAVDILSGFCILLSLFCIRVCVHFVLLRLFVFLRDAAFFCVLEVVMQFFFLPSS